MIVIMGKALLLFLALEKQGHVVDLVVWIGKKSWLEELVGSIFMTSAF
jgi:hypothetical protein